MKGKGQSAPYMLLVIVAVLLIIGIYVINQVVASFTLPTVVTRYTNETVGFAANNTYYSFADQASCLSDLPIPTQCGTIASTGVASVVNASIVLNSTCYSWTTSQIKLIASGKDPSCNGVVVGNYKVSYDNYDYQSSQAGSSYRTVQTTTWSAMQLAAVGLVTLAASLVLGALFFKQG